MNDLPVLAANVFGTEGATWLSTPHVLLDGLSPLDYAEKYDDAKVRQILNAIEHGGVV